MEVGRVGGRGVGGRGGWTWVWAGRDGGLVVVVVVGSAALPMWQHKVLR